MAAADARKWDSEGGSPVGVGRNWTRRTWRGGEVCRCMRMRGTASNVRSEEEVGRALEDRW